MIAEPVKHGEAIRLEHLPLGDLLSFLELQPPNLPYGSLTGVPTVNSVPTGAVFSFAGSAAPTGYLMCDGSAVSRTVYASLFELLSTTYGVGDGSTTFNLPDLRGRVPVGLSSGGPAEVNALGDSDGLAANLRNISHHHTYRDPGSTDGTGSTGGVSGPNAPGTATSGDANNTDKPAYLVVNFIIKA